MKPGTYERDEEVKEIKEAAQRMAERMSRRFVLDDQKVKRFQNASSQRRSEIEEDDEPRRTDFNGPVLQT